MKKLSIPERIKYLKEIKQKIATKDKWTTRTEARDIRDVKVNCHDPSACKWCLTGAILNIASAANAVLDIYEDLFSCANEVFPYNYIYAHALVGINDQLGFEAVHQLLDYTINKLEQQS